jgi:hypothetical protein
MTVDELVKLAEALTYDYSIGMLFEGAYATQLMHFADAEKALLVRFLAGERPVAVPMMMSDSTGTATIGPVPGYPGEVDWRPIRIRGGAFGVEQQIQQQPDGDDEDDVLVGPAVGEFSDDFAPKGDRRNAEGRIQISEAGASITLP